MIKNKEFARFKCTNDEIMLINKIRALFDDLLCTLLNDLPRGRELNIVKTKLEEACFFSNKAISTTSHLNPQQVE
jgi:hypothetical protein